MSDLHIDPKYQSILSLRETEKAIKEVKDYFERTLAWNLNLQRVSAPLFVRKGSGINDDLNGIERKVTFQIKDDSDADAEIVFSLAKWKRMVLADYDFKPDEGLYTDMNAIRADEDSLDNIHSIYVDQWDWERVITDKQRNLDFLKTIVRKIYNAIRETENHLRTLHPQIKPILPKDIQFVHTEELLEMYPDLDPRQREEKIVKEYGAVFIIGIGGELADGTIHDGRAPDYDDWITPTTNGKKGLNGDIFLWYPVLGRAFEISSMGIRVDRDAMLKQLEIRNALNRTEFAWHKRLLNGELPLSIGGGIGQSRLCMFLLRKMHVGEVHSSIWPQDMIDRCRQAGVKLL
ncbi:MAG: aspartate--ammonia ligase [Planctomycetes bacterium]|nr:aspartate--ammonia ligase [Planctomycetota bacterium]MBU1517659.1 aspartate--ammonia ligase [Planctomycetota bacterium]MBU2457883.1 aspartate--ammonia ligase [Planctomycetota bacterium]MBU2596831.1 aspartate--ammonia ligase [Planctomycetota bacterium]